VSDQDARIKRGILSHPKFKDLSCEAFGAWSKGLAWVKEKESDGRLSVEAAQVLDLPARAIATLVKVGLWEVATEFDGWVFHDYLDWNPSSSKVQEKLEANRRRVAKHRAAKKPPTDTACNAFQEEPKPAQTPPAVARVSAPAAAPLEPPAYAQKLIEREGMATVHDLVPTAEALEVGTKWFCELTRDASPGLVFDRHYFRHAYTQMGLRPERERLLVAKHYRLTEYIQARPSAWDPDHVWKKWSDFVAGPRDMGFAKPIAKTFQPGTPSPREEIEALAATNNPSWVKKS